MKKSTWWKKVTCLTVTVAMFSVTGLSIGSAAETEEADVQAKQGRPNFLNIAHRGASGYAPENTMAAFDKALELKANFIEYDVHMTKDGEVVLMHDVTLDRTTNGTGRVDEHTLEELRELDAGSWFSEEFTGEPIPTLEEVLDEYRGKIGMLIEVKDPASYPGIEEKIADALKERNMHKPRNGKVIVQSFDHASMAYFKELLPSVPVGVLVRYNADGISDEQLDDFQTYAEYVNPNHRMVDQSLVNRVQERGMGITPWTINDQERINALISFGVEGVITDFPDLVQWHKIR